MILYHGSTTGGIRMLTPRQADHDRPYIYLSTLEVVAAFYLCNAVERPYYWFPYGFTGDPNVPVYEELYPNALQEVASGVKGYLYTVEAAPNQVLPFKNIPCARLGTQPLSVTGCREVTDAYELFLDYVRQGRMKIGHYEDKSPTQLKRHYQQILQYIRSKEMYKTPDCSYAQFVKNKFPFVWEQYLSEVSKVVIT